MSQAVKLLQSGILDTDSDLQVVSQGNYVDALNIRHRDSSGSNMVAITPVNGNDLKVTIPNPTTSVKKFRVYLECPTTNAADYSGTLYLQNFSTVTQQAVTLGTTGLVGTVASVDTINDQITTAFPHGFTDGEYIQYTTTGTAIGGLASTAFYYVRVISPTIIQLYSKATYITSPSPVVSFNPSDLINLTSGGSGIQLLSAVTLIPLYNSVIVTLGVLSANLTNSVLYRTSATTGYFEVVKTPATALDDDFSLYSDGNFSTTTGSRDYVKKIVQVSEFIDNIQSLQIIGMESVGTDTIVFSCTGKIVSGTPRRSISEIGVVEYNDSTGVYTYTRILRSKQLGFDKSHQIQATIEKRGQDVNVYWTDDFNKPRTLTIPYPYSQDNVLVLNGGVIDYSDVDKETALLVENPASKIEFLEIIEGGGSLTCGNKRYTGRFLTDDFVGTDYLYPTNPINVYSAKKSIPSEIKGDAPGTVTGKAIKLKISNIPSGEFAYFELVAIEYEGENFTVKLVQRYKIGDETELIVSHTGASQDSIVLAPEEILALTAKVTKVKSLKIVSNRLFMSNLEEQVDKDLSEWASAVTHSLEIKQIPSVWRGNRFGANDAKSSYPTYRYGEYQDPNNVYNYVGYMMNDTYRFGIQVQWKDTGKWSNAYWIDDIRFDLQTANVTSPNRRTANNITTTNFTDFDSEYVNVIHPKFSNIDLSYSVNGTSLHKLIQAYRIVRAERIPEVLATGLFIAGTREKGTGSNVIPYHKDISYAAFNFSAYPVSYCRRNNGMGVFVEVPLGDQDKSEYAYFYSADHYFNNLDYTYNSGDIIKVLSVPVPYDEFTLQGNNKGEYESVHQEYTGWFSSSLLPYTNFNVVDSRKFTIGEVAQPWAGAAKLKNGVGVPPEGTTVAGVNAFYSLGKECHVFKLSTKLSTILGAVGVWPTGSGTFAREGCVYGQIFRNKGANAKYPINKNETVYESTGHIRILSSSDITTKTEDIFGGDIFTQKNHLKTRTTGYNEVQKSPLKVDGFGLAYSFYSQNVANTQMFYTINYDGAQAGTGYVYPQYQNKFAPSSSSTADTFIRDWSNPTGIRVKLGRMATGLMDWLEQWPEIENQNNYDSQYSAIDNSIVENGYDEDNKWDGKRPASIRWSQVKTTGSQKDNYRIFKPIDVVDLDTNQGEIVEMEIINGSLYTLQPYSIRRQFINEGQMFTTSAGTDVILGSGDVLRIPGPQLSGFGATDKFAVAKGRTLGGDESLYWYNSEQRKVVRLAGDGIRVISDKGMISFFQNNAKWVNLGLQPITGYGITSGFNQQFYEAVWAFKGIDPSLQQHTLATSYVVGNLVINNFLGDMDSTLYPGLNAVAPRHISGMSYVYRCKVNHLSSATDIPGIGASWSLYWDQLTPETHPQYYTVFSVVYDEVKNGFISKLSMWPNIMTIRTNTFYSTKPNEQNKIYVQNTGSYNTFYETAYDGHIEGVVNIDPNLSKTYEAIQAVTHTTPKRVDFTTRDHVSYLDDVEFEELEDFYYAPVKNDSTVSGVNSSDTSRLWGKYMKIKLKFQGGVFQKLLNYVVKYRSNPRLYNK
jgi:hypothetical protein